MSLLEDEMESQNVRIGAVKNLLSDISCLQPNYLAAMLELKCCTVVSTERYIFVH